jgi:hypothetical protein
MKFVNGTRPSGLLSVAEAIIISAYVLDLRFGEFFKIFRCGA